ncbi:hypothetical protein [Thermomonospora cellulosilytica]|uniref:Uncharacterized protein n=1 Tax=Thermomonospora cellulosilytica TaxID=1411118 RepID=A0A7W3R9F7_9ACTN|nr:hypothetical protein [Thermomonospora cellulosilytica]MBA9004712.1 hypothetical protein [Thermomonospora cellulosilytica]
MTDLDPQVLARARARITGPVAAPASEPVPAGLTRVGDRERVWALPSWPDGATPAVLEEYQTAAMPLDRPGQARRVLAAALRCCWRRLDDSPWPGDAAPLADVLEVYVATTRGDAELKRRWAVGDLRRLADTGWLLLDEEAGTVRPGPRTALWAEESLAPLRALLRRMPPPPVEEVRSAGEGGSSEASASSAEAG